MLSRCLGILFFLILFQTNFAQSQASPDYISLEIGMVRIAATRPGTTQNWVIPGKAGANNSCALLATLAKGAGLATGGAGLLVSPFISSACQPQVAASAKSDTDPNIYVRVTSNRIVLRSYAVAHTRSQSFKFKSIFPVDGIPKTGLVIEVINDDGSGDEDSQEVIGQFRLNAKELLASASNGTPISKKDGGVEKIELVVSAEKPQDQIKSESVDVQKGLSEVEKINIYAGQVVEVFSTGSYRVSDQANPVGPLGYSGKGKVYPDVPFNNSPLGAALVRIGKKGLMKGYLVNPCVSFFSPYEAALAVGINNNQPTTSRGDLKFEVKVRNATAEEWLNGDPKKCAIDASEIANKTTVIDYAPFARKATSALNGLGDNLAVGIIGKLHPTGKNAKLKSVDAVVTETGVEVNIVSTWNGGFFGDAYTTTVKWELNAERHINVSLMQDSAKILASEKAKKALNEYFVSSIDPLVRK